MLLICDLLAITIILTGLGKHSNGTKTKSSRFGWFFLQVRNREKELQNLLSLTQQYLKKEKSSEFVPFLT